MAIYRVSLLNEEGVLEEQREVECDNDDEAVDRAAEIDHPNEVYVWREDRLVARFPPKSELTFRRW